MSPAREVAEGLATIRPKRQITVPPVVMSVLGAAESDQLQFTVLSDGTITVTLLRLYVAPSPLEVQAARRDAEARERAAAAEREAAASAYAVQW